jgi:hydroxyacylglutathione hydrolase
MILFTHSHWDHTADAALLKEAFHAPIFIHESDAGNLEHPGSDQLPLFIPIKGVKADHYLHDGQILELGELRIRVIHTPGHTPGCVCFYEETHSVLVSGDTLFKGTLGSLSLPTARPARMEASLKKLGALPKKTRVYPGHGETTTIGDEHWINTWR